MLILIIMISQFLLKFLKFQIKILLKCFIWMEVKKVTKDIIENIIVEIGF